VSSLSSFKTGIRHLFHRDKRYGSLRSKLARVGQFAPLTILSPYYIEQKSRFNETIKAADYARGRLLDIGCGSQPFKSYFVDRVELYLGLDISNEEGVDIVADALQLPFASHSFDTVLCTQSLEHVPDPDSVFREISRVLKNGGILILSAPMAWQLHCAPHDYYRFTHHALLYLAKENSLTVEYIKSMRGFFATMGQLLNNEFIRLASFLPVVLLSPIFLLVNIVSLLLDRISQRLPIDKLTLGYIMVARKEARNESQ